MRSVRYRFCPPKTRSVRHYFPISVFSVFLLRNRVVRIRYTGLKCHQIFSSYRSDGVYTVSRKNSSVHLSLHRTWFLGWTGIDVFQIKMYVDGCKLNEFEWNYWCEWDSVCGRGQNGGEGGSTPSWYSWSFFCTITRMYVFSEVLVMQFWIGLVISKTT